MKATALNATFVFVVTLLVSQVALPCSVAVVESPDAITKQADLILRVKIVGLVSDESFLKSLLPGNRHLLTAKVLEVLKGKYDEETIETGGDLDYQGPNKGKPPYKIRRPGQGADCCIHGYKKGGEFLLFFSHGVTCWTSGATNEEVSGSNDPWVLWVKDYLRSQK